MTNTTSVSHQYENRPYKNRGFRERVKGIEQTSWHSRRNGSLRNHAYRSAPNTVKQVLFGKIPASPKKA